MTAGEAFSYAARAGERLIFSDDVAVVLVSYEGRIIKAVYPDGRVEPFTGPEHEGRA